MGFNSGFKGLRLEHEIFPLVSVLAMGIQDLLGGVLTAVMSLYINTMLGTVHCLAYTSI